MEGIEARNNVEANGATIHQMLWILLLFGTSKRKMEAKITPACQGNCGCRIH